MAAPSQAAVQDDAAMRVSAAGKVKYRLHGQHLWDLCGFEHAGSIYTVGRQGMRHE